MAIKTNQEFIQRLGTIKSEAEQPNPSRQALAAELTRLAEELYPVRTAGADLKDSLMGHTSEFTRQIAEAIVAGIPQHLKYDGARTKPGVLATYFHILSRGYSRSDLETEVSIGLSVDESFDIIADVSYKSADSLNPLKQEFKIGYRDPGQKLVDSIVKFLSSLT